MFYSGLCRRGVSPNWVLPTRRQSANGMVGPCSSPASGPSWRGAPRAKEHAMSQKLSSEIAVIGIDIGKNSFHLVGQNRRGALMLRQKWSRGQVEARLAN